MRRLRLACWLPVALALSGCGGSSSPLKAGGPHQGVLIRLPAGKGFAELVLEPLPRPVPRSGPSELVLYFLGPDSASALSPLPTEVMLDVLDPESRQKAPRRLNPAPKAGDPVGGGRFASGPVDVDYSHFSIGGELQANLGAGEVRVPF